MTFYGAMLIGPYPATIPFLATRSIINKGHREMTIVVAPFSIPKIP